MHTPDDHGAPSRTDGATPRTRGARAVLVIVVLLLLVTTAVREDPAAFCGAVLLYLADNAPEEVKGKVRDFLAGLLRPLNGCRSCEA
ncbi:hypothetical protein KIK06_09860 [Nocardiopsis sp. EMB25]|uniref:hypothetical protein n=1 Tax=Nocardiopsis sp. EMB25 TaxID=2835867 RepID=UPI002283B2BF|nr:hypothetical protein [Nocardiopsis sp. EMB25]MCY9784198.1 hypothetical protein [Nocardiopsis sp. EMB25]